jgi:hypothetical protein
MGFGTDGFARGERVGFARGANAAGSLYCYSQSNGINRETVYRHMSKAESLHDPTLPMNAIWSKNHTCFEANLVNRPLDISVVLPTFNERENIPELIARLKDALRGLRWELF